MALLACPHCSRHVRRAETRCPFCAAALALPPAPRRAPLPRMGRAATFAFGAALSTSVPACSATHAGEDGGLTDGSALDAPGLDAPADALDAPTVDAPTVDAPSVDAPRDGAAPDAGGAVPPYGAPAPDAPDNEEDAGPGIPIYGGPPPPAGRE
jgi:hypothetical protein